MNKKRLVVIMVVFTCLLGVGAIYIGSRLGNIPTTTPLETEAAIIDPETKIDYQFNSGNGTCTLEKINGTLCLAFSGSYNQFTKNWCYGDWSSNAGGCSCPHNGYGTNDGQCAINYSPKPGSSYPGENPACLDGQFGIQNCNPEVYFTHSTTYPKNYANIVCLDKSWCEFQQIDLLVGTGNYTCFLSGYLGNTNVCQGVTQTPTNTPSITTTNSPVYTPTLTITGTPVTRTPTVTFTSTPTTPGSSSTPTSTPTKTPTFTPTSTPTNTITNTPTNTPVSSSTVTPTITKTPTASPSSSPTTTPKVSTIPTTALVSDSVDQIIFGLMIIISGLYLYLSGNYIKIGNLFWNNGGKGLSYTGESAFMKLKIFFYDGGYNFFAQIKLLLNNTKISLIKINLFFYNLVLNFLTQGKHLLNNIKTTEKHLLNNIKTTLQDQKSDSKTRYENKIIREREEKSKK